MRHRFGQDGFDHSKFLGFGNAGYFAFADYAFVPVTAWPVQARQTELLPSTQARLKAGQALKIVAHGDSITAGGDASKPGLIFWQRWADELQRQHPTARVTAVNGARRWRPSLDWRNCRSCLKSASDHSLDDHVSAAFDAAGAGG